MQQTRSRWQTLLQLLSVAAVTLGGSPNARVAAAEIPVLCPGFECCDRYCEPRDDTGDCDGNPNDGRWIWLRSELNAWYTAVTNEEFPEDPTVAS